MKQPQLPENGVARSADAIRRGVELDALITDRYDDICRQVAQQKGRYTRLPSPFRSPGDTSKSVVIFFSNGSLFWADPLAPAHVPRDVIGFVMAFDRCSYDEAIERLWAVLERFDQYRADEKAAERSRRREQTRRRLAAVLGIQLRDRGGLQ